MEIINPTIIPKTIITSSTEPVNKTDVIWNELNSQGIFINSWVNQKINNDNRWVSGINHVSIGRNSPLSQLNYMLDTDFDYFILNYFATIRGNSAFVETNPPQALTANLIVGSSHNFNENETLATINFGNLLKLQQLSKKTPVNKLINTIAIDGLSNNTQSRNSKFLLNVFFTSSSSSFDSVNAAAYYNFSFQLVRKK